MAPEVAAGTPLKGNRTGAFVPEPAGPWIWDAVAGAVKALQFSSTVIWVCAAFRTTVPKPVPGEPLGGVSPVPRRKASNVVWADATPAASAVTITSRVRIFFIYGRRVSCPPSLTNKVTEDAFTKSPGRQGKNLVKISFELQAKPNTY